jgi:hypothetical protein
VDNNYLDLGANRSGFVHPLPMSGYTRNPNRKKEGKRNSLCLPLPPHLSPVRVASGPTPVLGCRAAPRPAPRRWMARAARTDGPMSTGARKRTVKMR